MTEPADDPVFMMGQFPARVPTDRGYATNHLWLQETAPNRYRVGFTSYSVRLLQDVYFLDWSIDPETEVAAKANIGEVESSKAVSSLHVPFAGRVELFNDAPLDDPSVINTDGYGAGWLYELTTDGIPLSPAEYLSHLEAEWEKTQRVIKGQVNS